MLNPALNFWAFPKYAIRANSPLLSNVLKDRLVKICVGYWQWKSTILSYFFTPFNTIKESKHIRTYQIMFEELINLKHKSDASYMQKFLVFI